MHGRPSLLASFYLEGTSPETFPEINESVRPFAS